MSRQAERIGPPEARGVGQASGRAIWEAGDFARIAELTLAVGTDLVERVGVRPGMQVLDVATGTGNAAIAAAAAGAHVTALDIAPELLAKAHLRAANRGLDVEWIEGDAEDLPFEDGRFDRVVSTFGVQFAAHHQLAARELARVRAPGGVIGLANWTPESAVARTLALISAHDPAPDGAPAAPLWGSEAHVRRLFAATAIELELDRATLHFEYNGSAEEFIDFYAMHFGPLAIARERLTSVALWEPLREQLVELWESANEAGRHRLRAPAEYLVVIGHDEADEGRPTGGSSGALKG